MSISTFPAEVLEQIFIYLDGHSFSVSKQVCSSWYEIIKKLHAKQTLWKKFCLKEIPFYVVAEILSYKNIVHDNPIDWFQIYKKWYQGRIISVAQSSKKVIQAFHDNPVTSLKHSGTWIITGHSNGILCVWNQQTGQLCEKSLMHLKMITDIALVDLLNLGSYYGCQDFPWAHHHIITVSKDSLICVKSLLEPFSSSSNTNLNLHSDVLKAVKVYGNYFAVSCRDNTVSLWHMRVEKKPSFHLEVLLLRSIIGPADVLLTLGFWNKKIHAISFLGKLKEYDSKTDKWNEKVYFKNSCAKAIEKVVCVISYYTFRDQIIIMFTADGKMIVSVSEACIRHYNLMRTLQTLVVSIDLQGTILALGGENGKLYLFHIESNQSLLNLNLSSPSFVSLLSEASIIAVDVSFNDNGCPVIIAATTDSLYVCDWYRQRSLHQHIRSKNISKLFKR